MTGCVAVLKKPSEPTVANESGRNSKPLITPPPLVDTADTADKVKPTVAPDAASEAVAKQQAAQPVLAQDFWQRLRAGFALPELNTQRVAYYERQFTATPESLEQIFTRASWFLPSILAAVEAQGQPTEVALLPAIESAFKPAAKSHSGASGLWQFIASTGRLYGMEENWWYDARRDPELATAAAIQFLGELNTRFDGDWLLSFAGYNAGGGNIKKAIRRNQRNNQPTHFSALKLRKETTDYVPKLIALRNIVRNPQQFNIMLPDMPNAPLIATFDAEVQIDLRVFAASLGVDQALMRFLNRAYKRGITPPDGPHRIQLPIKKLAIAKQKLAALRTAGQGQGQEEMQGQGEELGLGTYYRVRPGDVLGRISAKHHVSVAVIKRSNKLASDLIRVGQILFIPEGNRVALSPIAEFATGSATAVATGASTEIVSNGGLKQIIHVVQKGDTLSGIAKRFGVKVAQIAVWNKIKVTQILNLGQKLRVYPNIIKYRSS